MDDARPTSPLDELNQRLRVVKDRVRGVARRRYNGFYLFGRPGTSKTYTVRTTLDELKQPHHYALGHLAPIGLLELLAEQHDRTIVLDDVSELFRKPIALQILLAALGNQPSDVGERLIRYRRQGRDEVVRFTGGIICISNLELRATPLLGALKSRVHYLEYDPNDEQVTALMIEVASKGWGLGRGKMTPQECLMVADHLIAESKRLGTRLNMRLLVDKAFPDYLQHRSREADTHWKDLVTSTLQEHLIDLTHTTENKPATRAEQKIDEHRIIRDVFGSYFTPQERLDAWRERSGKSDRAFYRRLKEIMG